MAAKTPAEPIARDVTLQMGKPIREARREVLAMMRSAGLEFSGIAADLSSAPWPPTAAADQAGPCLRVAAQPPVPHRR